ncbi:MAG: hypothetical protein EOL97_13745 [Spirochaetia bacterium]|nr:hypothetical protein [Spirochaetia bacterium]
MIKLFDIKDRVVVPTEHCYTLKTLKTVMDTYEDYMKAYLYLFYMSCPNPDLNPFFDTPELDKEELIFRELGEVSFTLEDPEMIEALEFTRKLYETPTFRLYNSIKNTIDKLADYLNDMVFTDGKDGNISQVITAISKFDALRSGYKGVYKDLMEEQKSVVRGNSKVAYDQR